MLVSDSDLTSLKNKVSLLEKRISQLESQVSGRAQGAPEVPEAPRYESQVQNKSASTQETTDVNLEALLGGNWLVKIGVAALVLGIGFFLKLAFDNGWIGPGGRIILGVFIGFCLLFAGERFQKKYTTYAQILTGGGIAVLYVSVYAAYAFYSLIPAFLTFFFMALVTATAGLLSLRYDKPSVAIIGIAGGFITPFIFLKTISEFILIAYIFVLDYGIIGLSALKNWRKLVLIGMIGSYVDYLFWTGTSLVKPTTLTSEIILTLIFLIFAFSSILWHLIWKKSAEDSDLAIITGNAGIYFGLSYLLLHQEYKDFMGIFTFLLALFYAGAAYTALRRAEKDAHLSLFLTGISIVFLTLTMPIQLHKHWITIAWATEALVLTYLGFYLDNYRMRMFGLIVYILVAVRLLLFDSLLTSFYQTDYVLIFNNRFFPFFVSVLSFYGALYLYHQNKKYAHQEEEQIPTVLAVAANFLSLWVLTTEVIQYFDQQVSHLQQGYRQYTDCTYYNNCPTGFASISRNLTTLNNAKNFAISFLWMAYSILLITIGLIKRVKILRILGLILFWITIFKVFLIDMFRVGGSYRVASFISLGVILLVTGYLYQRFSKKVKELLIASIILLILFAPSVHAEFSQSNWKYEKKIELPALSQKRLVNLEFDTALYSKSSSDLHDLRIITNGEEVPYKFLIAEPKSEEDTISAKVFNTSFTASSTSFMVDLFSSGKLHDSIEISLSDHNFRREVTVEGSDDASSWRILTNRGVIYDYSDAAASLYARNTKVSYPESTVRYLRVTIQGAPLTVIGAHLAYQKQTQQEAVTYTASLVENSVDSEKKTSIIIADLQSNGLPSDTITFMTGDVNFERDVTIEGSNDKSTWNTLKDHDVIFSLNTPKFTGSNVTIQYPEASYRYLRATIYNRDNKPISIEGVRVRGIVRKLVFEADPSQAYHLYYGNTTAGYPQYDIERYFQYLDTQNLPQAVLSTEEQNPRFVEKLPSLPPLTERYPWLLPSALVVGILILGAFVINLIQTTRKTFPQRKRR